MAQVHTTRATTPSQVKVQDAVALLKQDHRVVEGLFKDFEDSEGDDGVSIAQRICQLLTVHAQIEEEILYPAAKDVLAGNEEEAGLVYEAEVEHATVKDLVAKIEEMQERDETYDATVTVLSEYIKHHVKEEEGELFPLLKKSELDLKDLGVQLFERKQTLMSDLGIEEDEQSDSRKGASARGGKDGKANAKSASSKSAQRRSRH